MADTNSPTTGNGAAADAAVANPATSVTAQTTPAQTPPAPPVDLTQLPEFRAFQANADRVKAADRAEAQRLRQERDALQAQLAQRELNQIENLDPVEQVRFLRGRLDQQAQQAEAARQAASAAQQRQANVQLVNNTLARLKLVATDPEVAGILNQFAEPTAEAVAQINSSLGELAIQRLEVKQAQQLKEAQSAARVAQVQALDDAGVTATSAGNTATVVPSNDRDKQIAAFKRDWQRLRTNTKSPAFRSLMDRMRAARIEPADLQRS